MSMKLDVIVVGGGHAGCEAAAAAALALAQQAAARLQEIADRMAGAVGPAVGQPAHGPPQVQPRGLVPALVADEAAIAAATPGMPDIVPGFKSGALYRGE